VSAFWRIVWNGRVSRTAHELLVLKKWGLFAFFVEVFSVYFVGFSEARVLYKK
jgi:hypothetical protein